VNTENLKEFVALEKEKADLKLREKTINTRLDELSELITKQFVEDGIQSTNIDGRTVYMHRDLYASPIGGDKEAVARALKESDLSQYVREDYNANSLKAYVREMVRGAEERARVEGTILEDLSSAIPPGLAATLKLSTVYSVSSRRS
jgi:hypothetical protein